MLFMLPLSFPMPHLQPHGIFRVKEAIWDSLYVLYFHPLVLQEEVLPSGSAGRWILQPQLLQRREHLQGTQRNHLPWLMHGGCSGKRQRPDTLGLLKSWHPNKIQKNESVLTVKCKSRPLKAPQVCKFLIK